MSKYSLKTDKDLLREAEMKIGTLENAITEKEKHIAWLTERVQYLIVCMEALDDHFTIGGLANAKPIFDAFMEKEDAKIKATIEEAKLNFAQNLKDGKIEIIDRTAKE